MKAGTILLAATAGLSSKLQDVPRVSVLLFGDRATDHGRLHEFYAPSSVLLSVVFVFENKFCPIQISPPQWDAESYICAPGKVHGMQVDGSHVLAAHQVAFELVAHVFAP
jgi:TPP-dependent pyruvate/acetoin dehydrogenase alpha subunit